MSNINKIAKKLRNLPQYKNLSEEEIELKAKEQAEKEELLGSLTFAINDEERNYAKNLLENYLAENSVETFADKETLRQLIDLELIVKRIKEQLKKEYEKANPVTPLQMIDELEKLNEQINELKEKLGFVRKDGEEKSSYSIIEDLKNRFKKWINMPDNRANYTLACPKCEELILIRRRIDKEKDEVKQHPWYREGGLLFNKEIFADLNDKQITKEQAARYLDCSVDYIDWILNNYPISEDKIEEDV